MNFKAKSGSAAEKDIAPAGRTFSFSGPEEIRPELIETFSFHSPDQLIATETKEFSAVCPFSGLPDLATLRVEYYPRGGKCVELRSLKYYLISFRNVGIYQEEATRRIREDLEQALGCPVKVTTLYNTRGGFDTVCTEGKLE